MTDTYLQQDQPAGVAPLALNGERTLPDVPAENYWYRRHLIVYEWIARRVTGRRVVDIACGEGYGSAVLARRRRASSASTPTQRRSPTPWRATADRGSFERGLVELWRAAFDAVVFLQTIEHVQDRRAVLAALLGCWRRRGVAYVSTPNLLTLRRPGPRSRRTRGTSRSTAPTSSTRCALDFGTVCRCHGLAHARRLRAHELALRLARWDAVHPALQLTKRSTTASCRRSPRRTSPCARRRPPRPRAAAADFLAVLTPCPRPTGDRPAHPHALHGGWGVPPPPPPVRHVAVRRGAAVRGDRQLLRAVARRARGRRPAG